MRNQAEYLPVAHHTLDYLSSWMVDWATKIGSAVVGCVVVAPSVFYVAPNIFVLVPRV